VPEIKMLEELDSIDAHDCKQGDGQKTLLQAHAQSACSCSLMCARISDRRAVGGHGTHHGPRQETQIYQAHFPGIFFFS
jgi:hypothetical protein